ncbi:MAG: malate dehydrogenase (quinone) [Saprospiraceae bacterium]|nr:malate dehydrogenase (quinone) [Saprospiraceae bacterium]
MEHKDVVLIGAGIMSATLGVLIKELMPGRSLVIYERLDRIAAESSDAWNNAGTGHSSFCELNYTPSGSDGSVDISKAIKIACSFEVSKQFWAFLQESGRVQPDHPFINDIDHMSFVWGRENRAFLRERHQQMTKFALFEDMLLSEDRDEILEWIPLMMEGRDAGQKVAATRMPIGTDVNFGAITRGMIEYLESSDNVDVILNHEVKDLTQEKNGRWIVEVKDRDSKCDHEVAADFVFIGAGGGSLPLLDKSDIPEARGYGGFPVSGQWLRCTNPEVIVRHEAKVYGKAASGSPPMSVPHLDTRMMEGERALLFGPYAGFSTKFLKEGHWWDLPLSVEAHNIWPMLSAGFQNFDLTKYLIKQVMQSPEDRFEMLQQYFPLAQMEDWELAIAGQRVQIIKEDDEKGGVLKFGTEVVANADRSLACLLGASPGASTAVSIMLEVLNTCFEDIMKQTDVLSTLRKLIPSYGSNLAQDEVLCKKTRERTTAVLQLA